MYRAKPGVSSIRFAGAGLVFYHETRLFGRPSPLSTASTGGEEREAQRKAVGHSGNSWPEKVRQSIVKTLFYTQHVVQLFGAYPCMKYVHTL